MECIILAGGLGTRLQGVLEAETPKCLAPINGRPFLEYLLRYLENQQCSRVILALGHHHHAVLEWLKTKAFFFRVEWSIEKEPLGTGGAIRKAVLMCRDKDVLVMNGDTMFDANLPELMAVHQAANAAATLALKPMKDFERYGTVQLNDAHRIIAFEEKAPRAEGLINGGIYALNVETMMNLPLPPKFSFEKHFLEAHVSDQYFAGFVQDGYFIDIGVPGDFERAQEELQLT